MVSKVKKINEMEIKFMETDNKIVLFPNRVFRLGRKRLGLSKQEINAIYEGVKKTWIKEQGKLIQLKVMRERRLIKTKPIISDREDVIKKDSFIYFVLDTVNNAVKIGYSTNPKRRIHNLQSSTINPLKLIHTLQGDVKSEYELQERFWRDKIKNEWFNYSDDIKAYIKSQ